MVELYNCDGKRVFFFSRNFPLTAWQLLQPTVGYDVAQTRSTPMQHPPSFRAQTKPPPFVPSTSFQRESHVHVSSPLPLRSISPSLRLSDDAAASGFFALRLLDLHVAHLFRALIAPGCRNLISRQIPAQREKGMTTYILAVRRGKKKKEKRAPLL